MITLPQLITTDTDMTADLTSGKITDSAEDFLALLTHALGADGAQGKEAHITLADLQSVSRKLSKGLLIQHRELGQTAKLTDLLAQKADTTDETLTDLTQAQYLLSTLTPSLKTSALTVLGKTAQYDEETPALNDEALSSLSALFAMLPGQPVTTPVVGETPTENHTTLPSLLRSDMRTALQETHTISFSEHERGKTDASRTRVSDDHITEQSLTPLVVAATATNTKVDVDNTPAPVTPSAVMPPLSNATAQAQQLPSASAPVLSAPLGSYEWQQTFSQQVTLFTRQGQQSVQLRLHPEELGQVHISLKLDDNQAQLQMVSPHSHVRATLEAALPMLRTQLAENGIQLGQSSISSESFTGQQQSSSQQQPPARTQHADMFSAEDGIVLTVPVSLQTTARGNGSVDIFA